MTGEKPISLCPIGVTAAPSTRRHQLCTEADTQQRTTKVEPLFDQPEFLRQKGVRLFAASPNGRTQHNQKIGFIHLQASSS